MCWIFDFWAVNQIKSLKNSKLLDKCARSSNLNGPMIRPPTVGRRLKEANQTKISPSAMELITCLLTPPTRKKLHPLTGGEYFPKKTLKPKFILKLLACCQWKANNTLNANNGHVHLILLFFQKCTTLWRFGSQQTANLWMSNLFPSFFKNN